MAWSVSLSLLKEELLPRFQKVDYKVLYFWITMNIISPPWYKFVPMTQIKSQCLLYEQWLKEILANNNSTWFQKHAQQKYWAWPLISWNIMKYLEVYVLNYHLPITEACKEFGIFLHIYNIIITTSGSNCMHTNINIV